MKIDSFTNRTYSWETPFSLFEITEYHGKITDVRFGANNKDLEAGLFLINSDINEMKFLKEVYKSIREYLLDKGELLECRTTNTEDNTEIISEILKVR